MRSCVSGLVNSYLLELVLPELEDTTQNDVFYKVEAETGFLSCTWDKEDRSLKRASPDQATYAVPRVELSGADACTLWLLNEVVDDVGIALELYCPRQSCQ